MCMVKGYDVWNGYMGHIGNNKYMLFASESDYKEYIPEPDYEEKESEG